MLFWKFESTQSFTSLLRLTEWGPFLMVKDGLELWELLKSIVLEDVIALKIALDCAINHSAVLILLQTQFGKQVLKLHVILVQCGIEFYANTLNLVSNEQPPLLDQLLILFHLLCADVLLDKLAFVWHPCDFIVSILALIELVSESMECDTLVKVITDGKVNAFSGLYGILDKKKPLAPLATVLQEEVPEEVKQSKQGHTVPVDGE